jgi:hypothetical protein
VCVCLRMMLRLWVVDQDREEEGRQFIFDLKGASKIKWYDNAYSLDVLLISVHLCRRVEITRWSFHQHITSQDIKNTKNPKHLCIHGFNSIAHEGSDSLSTEKKLFQFQYELLKACCIFYCGISRSWFGSSTYELLGNFLVASPIG